MSVTVTADFSPNRRLIRGRLHVYESVYDFAYEFMHVLH
jgi:hypothetical protein